MLLLEGTGEENHHTDPGACPTQGDTDGVRGSKCHSAFNQDSAGTAGIKAGRPALLTKKSIMASVEMRCPSLPQLVNVKRQGARIDRNSNYMVLGWTGVLHPTSL